MSPDPQPDMGRWVPPGPPPFLAVNGTCDLRCAWCNYEGLGAASSSGEVERVRGELERLRGEGHDRVGLGLYHTEPTRHPELPAIVRLARQLGFEYVTLSTSGLRLAERDYVAELRREGLSCVGLTMLGLDHQLSDLLFGSPGATAAKLKAIENCLAEGLELYVIVLLLRPVLRDLAPAIGELIKLVVRPNCVLHGIVPDAVKETPLARVAALWPRYDEVAWLMAQPGMIPGFAVHSSDMPECARHRIPGIVGPQVVRPDFASSFARVAAVCGECADYPECGGVEPNYLAAYGNDFAVAAGPREPARPDLDQLRALLAEGKHPVVESAPPGEPPLAVLEAPPRAADEGPALEPWQRRAAERLEGVRAGRGATLAGYALKELKVAPGRIQLEMVCGGDTMELYVEPRPAASRFYKAGRTLAVSYRPPTPPNSPARRRLVTGLLRLLDEGR
jgi:hypothetical protein